MLKQKTPKSWKKDPYLEYLDNLSRTAPLTGWTLVDDEDYLIHDLLAFRYFSMFLRSQKKAQQDSYIFEFWNEVHDLREIEDVSCRLVRALSIIETYILTDAPYMIGLPQNQSEALTAYHKKYLPIADKIKQGGNIRQKDQSKVADPRPLFTNLQTHLFDRIKKTHWKQFCDSQFYEEFKRLEKKEIKRKDLLTSSATTSLSASVVVPTLNSAITRYLNRSNGSAEEYRRESGRRTDALSHSPTPGDDKKKREVHGGPVKRIPSLSSISDSDSQHSSSASLDLSSLHSSSGRVSQDSESLTNSQSDIQSRDNSTQQNDESNIYANSEEDEIPEVNLPPEEITTKLNIQRSSLREIEESWEHRSVFDFYVSRVLKKGRAPSFLYLVRVGLKSEDPKVLLQLVTCLYRMLPDLGLSDVNIQKLTKIYDNNTGIFSSGFMNPNIKRFDDEQQFKDLLPMLHAEVEAKIQNYYPKFLTSRPHALYLHLRSLYSQIASIMLWSKNAALRRNTPDDLQTARRLCQYFLNFFDQFGVDDFYTKQATKLKRDLSELEQRMSIYCTLDAFLNQLLPQIKYHSLAYICTKSPSIRYVISLLKVILKGLREDKGQQPVELPFIVKSTLCLGIPISPVHFVGLLEKRTLFGSKQNLGVLTTNCFFQYDQFATFQQTQSMTLYHQITYKRKIPFETIVCVSFLRDRKGVVMTSSRSLGFTIDSGKEQLHFEVATKKDRALWLLAFHSMRKTLVPERIVEWLYEQVENNYRNEDKLMAAMAEIVASPVAKE